MEYLFLIVFILILLIFFLTRKGKDSSSSEPIKRTTPTIENIGAEGENVVAIYICLELAQGLYGEVMQNLYIPRQDGGTSEIDVLLISTKGLFVFESKNFAGYIFGNDNQRNWTVTLFAGRNRHGSVKTEKHQFYNPIWQNKTHIKTLRNILKTPVPINSVVVFSDRGEIKDLTYDPKEVTVLKASEVRGYIANIRDTYPDVITQEGVNRIYERLLPYQNADEATREEHLAKIEERKTNPLVCPWCGKPLAVRTAQKGANAGKQFYGCTAYPNCKYTRNIP